MKQNFYITSNVMNPMRLVMTPTRRTIELHGVYFIEDPFGQIKIGRTNCISRRFQEIQAYNPHKLILLEFFSCKDKVTAEHLEKYLHRIFKEYRKIGEWFEGETIKEYIRRLKDETI